MMESSRAGCPAIQCGHAIEDRSCDGTGARTRLTKGPRVLETFIAMIYTLPGALFAELVTATPKGRISKQPPRRGLHCRVELDLRAASEPGFR